MAVRLNYLGDRLRQLLILGRNHRAAEVCFRGLAVHLVARGIERAPCEVRRHRAVARVELARLLEAAVMSELALRARCVVRPMRLIVMIRPVALFGCI